MKVNALIVAAKAAVAAVPLGVTAVQAATQHAWMDPMPWISSGTFAAVVWGLFKLNAVQQGQNKLEMRLVERIHAIDTRVSILENPHSKG